MIDNRPERAILVGVELKRNQAFSFGASLEELRALTEAAGGEVVATLVQSRERIHAGTYIGKGKLEELTHLVEELVRIVLRLRHVRIEMGIDQLRVFQQDLPGDDFLSLAAYHEMILNYTKTRERIDQVLSRPLQLD